MGEALNLSDEELGLLETHLYRSIYGHPHKKAPEPGTPQVFGGTNILALLEKIKSHKNDVCPNWEAGVKSCDCSYCTKQRAEAPKECKGKAAARALAVLVLDPKISNLLALNDPKALEQSLLALEPFGWPDLDALRTKLGL